VNTTSTRLTDLQIVEASTSNAPKIILAVIEPINNQALTKPTTFKLEKARIQTKVHMTSSSA
jgi:hypothetical protein